MSASYVPLFSDILDGFCAPKTGFPASLAKHLERDPDERLHPNGQCVFIHRELWIVVRVNNPLLDISSTDVKKGSWNDALVSRKILCPHHPRRFEHGIFAKQFNQFDG